MNLYIRLIIVIIASFFKPRIRDILSTAQLNMRVLPNDLDTNGHMNNGRYFTVMDLGRMDLVLRTGLFGVMMRQGSVPVLSAATMRFRLPLVPFRPYRLETQVICWDEKWVFMEQRFVMRGGKKDGAVAAIGIVKGSFWNKHSKQTVPTADLLKIVGVDTPSPPMPDHIAQWQHAEEALKSVTSRSA